MRKNALKICCFVFALGAVGAFCRWLQNQIAFDDLGLSVKSSLNFVMLLVMLVSAIVFFVQTKKYKNSGLVAQTSFGYAFRGTTKLYKPVAWLLGAVMIFGGLVLFMTGEQGINQTFDRVLAVLAVFSGLFFPLTASATKNKNSSAMVCFFMTVPIVQFCEWLLTCYKYNSTNPTVWAYIIQIFAISASILAFYYLAGYSYGRVKTYNTMYFCMLGAFLDVIVLADNINFGEKMMFVSASGMLMFMAWMIISNMREPVVEESGEAEEINEAPEPVETIDVNSIINELKDENEI